MESGQRTYSRATVLALALLPAALLSSRLALPTYYISREGSPTFVAMRMLDVLPIVTALLLIWAERTGFDRAMRLKWAWVGIACIAADALVYVYSGLSEQSLKLSVALVLPVFASLGALATGLVLWKMQPSSVHALVAVSTIASAFAGVAQIAQRAGYSTLPGRWLAASDRAAVRLFGGTVDLPRAQGFELNPNIYSPMAAVGLLWALFGMPRGPLRSATIASSAVIVVLSQSRTTFMVMLSLLALSVIREVISETRAEAIRYGLKVAGLVAVLALGLLFVRFGPATIDSSGVVQRGETIDVEAVAMDAGVAGRLWVWRTTLDAIRTRPAGYLEGYREVTGSLHHPHNEALFRLLYAGPLWLLTHVIFLAWLAFWLRSRSHEWTGFAIATMLAVNGLTEPIYNMRPYVVLLYVIIGALMWSKASEASRNGAQTRSSQSS